ncbi:MAG: hypothetical protein IPL86_19220 [Flavobacteriales bacterium]|nr:hypothetical protein [Flavobacteriales bacterium]
MATAQKEQTKLVKSINDLVSPFGWMCDVHGRRGINALQTAEKDLLRSIVYHLSKPKASIGNPRSIPICLWQLLLLPPAAAQSFPDRSMNDAKAFSVMLLSSTARFYFWRNLGGETFTETALSELVSESLQTLPSYVETCYGGVFVERIESKFSIWFGRKAGKPPAISGLQIVQAVRQLFEIKNP